MTYQEAFAAADKIVDGLGKPIDAGIKPMVAVLNALEVPTSGSCEGHIERALSYPWVDIGLEPDYIEHSAPSNEKVNSLADNITGEIKKASGFALYATIRDKKNDRRYRLHLDENTNEFYEDEMQSNNLAEIHNSNIKLGERLMKWLTGFYSERSYDADKALVLRPMGMYGSVRLLSQGGKRWEGADEVDKRRVINDYQAEMEAFALYLRRQLN